MDRKIGKLMLREAAGFLLLAVLALGGLLTSRHMSQQYEAVSRLLEDSAWHALSGQWQQARDTAQAAREQWEQRWELGAALSDHTPMEEIDVLFAQLSVYSAANEPSDFSAACRALSRHMQAMGSAHQFRWWNVL